ncbi:hypothetical protein [Streptomyces sp. NPDC002619]|uniref:hypothetical protein n=1 Tax=Streptomyces sp. NPDC002619 TaxID=3364655 RepID=UPI00368644E1
MTDHPHTDEAALWARLATLLPSPEEAAEVQACWDIGEQEGGLTLLVQRIGEQRVPVDDLTRAEIALLAHEWGVWDQLGTLVAAFTPGTGRPERLRVLVDGTEEPVPVRSVLPDHPSPELLLVPWITCAGRGSTLARGHVREPWGDLSYLPLCYVTFSTGADVAPQVFAHERPGAVWSAFGALRSEVTPVRQDSPSTDR